MEFCSTIIINNLRLHNLSTMIYMYILRAKKPQKLKCNAKLVYKNQVHVYCEMSLFKHINLRYFNMIKYDNLNVSNQIWFIKDHSFAILKEYYAYFKPKKKPYC